VVDQVADGPAGRDTVDDIGRPHHLRRGGRGYVASGGAGDGDINEPIRLTERTRFTWLVVNLGTAVASSGRRLFQGTIASRCLRC
jgi:magnesium transporter